MRYPLEIASNVEQSTFYIENKLADFYDRRGASKKACEKSEQQGRSAFYPLMIYGMFSRFDLSIINKEKKAARVSVPALDMINIVDTSKLLYKEEKLYLLKRNATSSFAQEGAQDSPAYTVRFRMGDLKGLSPAEVLAQKSDGERVLQGQKRFLEQNVSKYPANQKIINAIDDAFKLKRQNALQGAKTQPQSVFTPFKVYGTPIKVNSYKKRNDEKCLCTRILINWTIGDKRSLCVEIENFWANIAKDEKTGLIHYLGDTIDQSSHVKNVVYLTSDWWNQTMHIIEANMRMFEDLNGKICYKESYDSVLTNMEREERKEKGNSTEKGWQREVLKP